MCVNKIESAPNNSRFSYVRWMLWGICQFITISCLAQAPYASNSVSRKSTAISITLTPNILVDGRSTRPIKVNDVQPPVTAPPNITYATPQTYKINNPISPLAPTNTGGSIPPTPYGQVTTVASGGFSITTSVAPDIANGVIYVCDWNNNAIKKVVLATGAISVFAGTGAAGSNNGPSNVATFNEPDAIVRDAAGNLYVSDQSNNLIRKITPDGTVSTLAGNVTGGSADGTGTAASFNIPRGLALDAAGNVYVADQGNNIVRKITPGGVVTTVARGFSTPTGVSLDAGGNMYVSELTNGTIKKVSPAGVITTYAVNVGHPREVRIDAIGNLYVADQDGSTIKKVSTTGVVTTLSTAVNGPIGLALDGLGNIYVGDAGSSTVKKISLGGYTIDKPLPAGLTFDATTGTISGTPTALSLATNYTITAYNISGSSTTVVNLAVTDGLLPSIITLPPFVTARLVGNILDPGGTSTNTQTPITYTSSNPAVATITADGKLAIHGPGFTQITANQAGNATYSPAAPTIETLTVTISQTLNFPAIGVKTACSADFALNVTTKDIGYGIPLSGIPITYISSNPSVATVSSTGMVHILSAGTTQITANEAGNTDYYAATPVSQTLTVATPVVPSIAITQNLSTICVGTPVTFTANVSNLSQLTNPGYQWQINGVNAGTNSSTFVSVVNNNDMVQCIVTNNSICPITGSKATLPIAVTPYINFAVNVAAAPSGPICQGASVKFVAKSANGITNLNYQWQVNGVNVGTNDTTYANNNFNNGDKITCTVSDNGSRFCTTPATSSAITMNIIQPVNTNASVTIQASGNNVYAGTTVVFIATTINATGTLSYQWQVNGKNAGNNSHTFSTGTLRSGDMVTCIVSSSTQCSVPFTSLAIVETILPPLVITPPNTFTPNGDGINDVWLIAGLDTYPGCSVAVYNRYGLQIFLSKGYTRPWDGTDNGKELPTGTYYYVIDLDQHRPKVAGYVAVIK